ncbi:MAG: DUF2277 domain-containing protein [Polyangiaceae bacterium]
MCRNIRPLFNFEPPATPEEIRAAATQYVRKVSGIRSPSASNTVAFDAAIDRIATVTEELLAGLETRSPAKDRAKEAEKARARSRARYG